MHPDHQQLFLTIHGAAVADSNFVVMGFFVTVLVIVVVMRSSRVPPNLRLAGFELR